MPGFVSSIGSQLNAFEANVKRFVRATLLSCGRRIRARMVEERLSAPRTQDVAGGRKPMNAPLSKKTGRLIRSIEYYLKESGNSYRLDAGIGRTAYYAEKYEAWGRLQFNKTAQEEMAKAQDEINIGLAFLARSPGASGAVSVGNAGVEPVVSPAAQAIADIVNARKSARKLRRLARQARKASKAVAA